MALLNHGDTILGMDLSHGGHLTHGSKVNFSGKNYQSFFYGLAENGYSDYDRVLEIAKVIKPKMIVCGASAYAREIDFKGFREIADIVGAYFLADVAHMTTYRDWETDRKSTRLNSSHITRSRMPSSA